MLGEISQIQKKKKKKQINDLICVESKNVKLKEGERVLVLRVWGV